jgi:hypothetical protein
MSIYRTFVGRFILIAALAVVFCAPALPANITWDWSYSSNLYTGSGTLETEPTTVTILGFTAYPIVSMTGTWGADAVTGLLPINTVGSNDNLLGVSIQKLSVFGVAFNTAADGPANIYHNGLTFYKGTSLLGGADNGAGTFSAVETSTGTPEPATVVLIGSTLLMLALFVRHRNINARHHP